MLAQCSVSVDFALDHILDYIIILFLLTTNV